MMSKFSSMQRLPSSLHFAVDHTILKHIQSLHLPLSWLFTGIIKYKKCTLDSRYLSLPSCRHHAPRSHHPSRVSRPTIVLYYSMKVPDEKAYSASKSHTH